MMITTIRFAAAMAVIFLSVTVAQAADPAVKCEAGKLKEAGKYGNCRLKADSKAVKKGEASDYTKCESKFSDKWGKTESKADGACPSNGDEAAVEALTAFCTGDIAAGLAPAPPTCPEDGSDAACAAFATIPECELCVDAYWGGINLCGGIFTCDGSPLINTACAQDVNTAGCGPVCCPETTEPTKAAVKCEAGKLKEAGKYYDCRLKSDSKGVKKGEASDYTKCESKFSDKWGKTESKADGACPSNGDEAAVEASVKNCTDQVALGLAPCVPDCTGKECGDDGCGGSCGTCGVNEDCGVVFEGICCGLNGADCNSAGDCCSTFCETLLTDTCFGP